MISFFELLVLALLRRRQRLVVQLVVDVLVLQSAQALERTRAREIRAIKTNAHTTP
jgi:hypothetical protein